MKIQEETAERILELMRLGHPNEKGEKYTRWDLVDEVRRRGLQLLKDLNWTTSLGSIYKNRYTGHEETFISLLNKWKSPQRKQGMFDELPFLIENWTPKELWIDKDVLDEYNPKGKLNSWLSA